MHNQLHKHFAQPRRDEFIPRSAHPLSFRTGLRFAANMLSGLRFTGGIFALLVSVLYGCAVLIWVVEDNWTLTESLYLVAITALTIGYGDITPQTAVGKCLSVFSGLVGVLCTGIVIAVAVEALRFTIRQEINERLEEHSAGDAPSGERGT